MKFRFFVLILVLTLLGALPALAADTPAQKNVPVAAPEPALSWNGFYAGINGGYVWGRTNHYDFYANPTTVPHNVSGSIAGGTVGYNHRLARKFVIGAEGDGDWANITGKTYCPNHSYYCSTHADALASIRGRFGYTKNRFLLFGTSGLGIGDFTYRAYYVSTGKDFIAPYAITKEGWMVGGGAEYALRHKITLKGEYDYYGFLNSIAPSGTLDGGGYAVTVNTNLQVFKIGVNYRF
jgi:outer membrane immunogenic protein